jgi:hypothetical protein
VVFWYLRKTVKEKEEINKRKSMKSEKSVGSFNDTNQRTASKIVIEMVNLKS